MKHILRKISYDKSKIIGHIQVKDSGLTVLSNSSDLRLILNGCEIFSSTEKYASDDVTTTIIASLVNSLKENDKKKLSFYIGDWKEAPDSYLKSAIDSIEKAIDKKNLSIFKKASDQDWIKSSLNIEQSLPEEIGVEKIQHNLNVLISKMNHLVRTLQRALDHGKLLCRKKVVPSMWGAKDTQKFINEIKYSILDNQKLWSQMEVLFVTLRKSINRLAAKIEEGLKENCEFIANVIIPDIIKCYEDMKTIVVKAITVLTPLTYIDEIFQKFTTYPANWFFTDEVLDGLQEEYDKLIKFLISIPIIETKVIYPLDFYKLQISY
jgi:hypothetical protein